MVTRRGFLAICGATTAAAALPGKEAEASTKKSLDYKLTTTRYVKPGSSYKGKYLKPGVYLGDTRQVVPEYEYCQQTGTRAYYEYLALLDGLALAPGYSVYYDRHTFLQTPGDTLVVQGHTNIPKEKIAFMWDEALRKAWMPTGTVCNPHRGTTYEDLGLTKAQYDLFTLELFDV